MKLFREWQKMLKISLDEAYVFDMLSVFDVKIKKLTGEKLLVTLDKHSNMVEEVIEQITSEKYNEIISSSEYKKMILANERVFELIDESKTDTGLAKITDDANFDRHIAKRSDLFHVPSCKLNQMSSFALPFVCKNKDIYNRLIVEFEKNGIEYRPLVAGNLLKQPCLRKYKFSYKKPFYNADIVHELGLYVGNNHMVNDKNIRTLKNIIESIPYDQD